VWKGGQEMTRSSEVLCVSSSFYDRRLCVWTVDLIMLE
jgi:diphthamide biosynthesis protein 7